jgi:hypothetical protein
MIAQERFEAALRSSDTGQALRALVQDLAREGLTKPQIYETLETFLGHLRTQADNRESDEELVLDIMDALTGWCHPSSELLPDGQ